jgi:nucleoside-diphosphate-sugar epimerase
MQIADMVRDVVSREFPEKGRVEIVTTPSDDLRSYHINSDKIKRVLGFVPSHSIEEAVRDLCQAFRDGRLPDSMDDDQYFNVRRLKRLKAA